MFKKLDWYILRQFIVTFVFCMLLFTVIAVAVDSSEKTDDFVKSKLGTYQIISQYYLGFVPYIWGMLYPLFIFIAVIFFTSRMAMRSEVIAILATGTTYNRWLRTYLVGGLFFATILWFSSRYAIPKANEIRSNFQAKYTDSGDPGKDNSSGVGHYRRTDSNTYIGLRFFDTSTKGGGSFFLNRLKNGTLVYNLKAEYIKWDPKKKQWHLTNVTERRIDSLSETLTQVSEMHMALNFVPRDLRRDYYLKDKLSTPELARLIKTEELSGNEGINTLKVEQYRRTSTPFSVILLTLIGAVIAGRRTRGGSGLHLAIGIIIAVSFLLLDRFSTVFSTKGNFPPLLAAWVPNIIFSMIAVYLYRRAPK